MEDKEMKGVKANISQFLQTLKLNSQILGLGQGNVQVGHFSLKGVIQILKYYFDQQKYKIFFNESGLC